MKVRLGVSLLTVQAYAAAAGRLLTRGPAGVNLRRARPPRTLTDRVLELARWRRATS